MTSIGGNDGQARRYAAFISYAHADSRWAQRIHRSLEVYRLPRGVAGGSRARVGRVFLDRSEFASSASLSEAIQQALDDSDSLVLICSPRSAASRWVNEEVARFRSIGRGDRIFCLIVDGDPAGILAQSPFPPALLETITGEAPPEPLAADVRPGNDRPHDAVLKLVSGIVGVPFDALRRREAVRRQRRLALVAMVSTGLLILMTGLAIMAVLARREAERQRDTALRTSTFMQNMFDQARPDAGGADITVRTMLDRAASDTLGDRQLRSEPDTRSDLLTTLAEVFARLGSLDRSATLLQSAAFAGDRDVDRLIAQDALKAEIALQRSDFRAARSAIDAGLARGGTNSADALKQRIRLLTLSGQVHGAGGDPERAELDFANARKMSLESKPPDRDSAAVALTAAAMADVNSGALDRAEMRLRTVIAERRALGQPLHPNVLAAVNAVGALAIKRGDAPSAESYFRQAIALQTKILGDQHFDTALSRSNLGRSLVEQRKFAEAKAALLSAQSTFIAQAGPELDSLANLNDSLGLAEGGLGDTGAARASFVRGLQIAKAHDMPKEIELLADRAELECRAGQVPTGLGLAREARAALGRFQLPEPWRSARIDVVEGGCLLASGNTAAAAALVRRGAPAVTQRWGRGSLFGENAALLEQKLSRTAAPAR